MRYIFLLIASFFLFSACKEKLDTVGNFKETAVVYGLLDKSNSVHMIKINRAFIGPGNSLEIAKIPDSSYFKKLEVKVEELGTGRSWTLQDTIISNKEVNGVFYGPEQKLYYFETTDSEPLLGDKTYKLYINVENGLFEISATTQLVDGMSATLFSQINSQMKFASNAGEYESYVISVNSGGAKVMAAQMKVKVKERIGGAFQPKYIDWFLGEKEASAGGTIFTIPGKSFYEKIRDNLSSSDPSVDRRNLDTITLTFIGGGEDLYNYMLINKPSSSLAQSKPTFTNLKATNDHEVIGIFSSRQTLVIHKPFHLGSGQAFVRSIDIKSTRELCQGPTTGTLLFCSDHPGDLTKPYKCN